MTLATRSLAEFNQITDAEAYFEFFDLAYDPKILNVNRLHILRKFSQLIQAIDTDESLSEFDKLTAYRQALLTAYGIFVTSSGVEQKLFKVFQSKPKNVVMLSDITVE